MHHKLRATEVVDEYGRQVPGAVAARVYDLDDISVLFVALNLIVANGGNPITVPEHGIVGDGLPPIPRGSLGQPRRNGWLTVAEAGSGLRVGLGERTRSIAAKWNIDLPPVGR